MQLLSDAIISAATADDCAEAILDVLPPVTRVVRRHMRSNRSRGLSLPQFRTLALLRAAPSANLSAVADFLGASLPTASRIVSGLVAKSFVVRREHADDRRQVELALTARGAAAVERARLVTREKLAKTLSTLSESDRLQLLRAMRSLYELFSPGLRDPDGADSAINGAGPPTGRPSTRAKASLVSAVR
jgi:DNA-binding MarR family transcriptional regulator